MSRSAKKGVFVEERLLERARLAQERKDRKPIKTWSRRSTLTPEFVGLTLSVHNGKSFHNFFVTENMIGHKVGEFAPTRTFKAHSAAGDKAKAMAAASKT